MSVPEDRQADFERAKTVKGAYEDGLMSRSNVVGVGVGLEETAGLRTGRVALVVLVERKVPLSHLRPQDRIPVEIEGVPVDVQEVGTLHAQG